MHSGGRHRQRPSRRIGMALLRFQLLLQKDPLVVRRVIEPAEFLVAELRIKVRPLKRKRVEKRGVAAERDRMPLRLGQESLANAAPAQRLLYPEQVHEQPSGIAIADEPGPDRSRDFGVLLAHENAEIRIARVAQKRRVISAERLVDELPVLPRRVLLEAEAKPWRQIHHDSP